MAQIDRSPTLTDRVIAELKRQIATDAYSVGQVLPSEARLCEIYGVSRTVVREAVSRLKAEGMVESRQGVGAIVLSSVHPFRMQAPSDEIAAILQTVEFRMAFETEAASLAAERHRPGDLIAIRAALEDMQTAIDNCDVSKGVEADLAFHRAICTATQNPHYLDFIVFLSQFLHRNIEVSRRHSARRPSGGAEAQAEHRMIYLAIDAGDPEAARLAARTHVVNTAARLRVLYQQPAGAVLT